jgi:hypothetical protein
MSNFELAPSTGPIELVEKYLSPPASFVTDDSGHEPLTESAREFYSDLQADFHQICMEDGPNEGRKSWLTDARGVKRYSVFWLSQAIPYQATTGQHYQLRLITKKDLADEAAQPTLGIELEMPAGLGTVTLAELDSEQLRVTETINADRSLQRGVSDSQAGDLLDFGKIVKLFKSEET